ncbi:MAG TPA: LemA family protein [Oligoflexia bacterium]|nr:LemA family protein [Oligoflexia bacterium]HMR24887.1 LemA family protein [Oligoflexia bacterium]
MIYILLGLLLLCISIFLGIYNRLVRLKNRYKNAFSQIDVQLKRRHDLIPNLVEVSKKYMEHEKETLTAVIQARQQASGIVNQLKNNLGDTGLLENLANAENALSSGLGKLFAVMENYPDLKANETMAQLSEELKSTENKISFSRQSYNDSVMTYNTAREIFPNNMVAGLFSFTPVAQLKIAEQERSTPKVKF